MMSTLLLMRPAASLQGTTRLYLTQMIQGATLTILVVAPPNDWGSFSDFTTSASTFRGICVVCFLFFNGKIFFLVSIG